MLGRADRIAKALSRSRNWVIQQAVDRYLNYEEWFVQQVTAGLEDVKRGKTIPHDDVMAEIREKIAKAQRGSSSGQPWRETIFSLFLTRICVVLLCALVW